MKKPETFQDQIIQYKKQQICPHKDMHSFLFSGLDFPSGLAKTWRVRVCKECDKIIEQK